MSKKPVISVQMPVYNAERYVAEAIESILKQTFDNFEFIIINDGSTDDSLTILEAYAKQDDRIRLISRSNCGLVATRNELMSASIGQYCALLDADDIALPERFAKQIEYMEQHPECVVLGSRLLLIDSDGDPICEFVDLYSHEEIDNLFLQGVATLFNSSVMMRREVVEQVGGYRDDYPPAEDVDMFLRLAERGKLVNLPEVLTKYRQHLSSEGYVRRQIQIRRAEAAANSARLRRGLPPLEQNSADEYKDKVVDHYRKWSWWALGGGNVKTARKYAIAALQEEPFSLESWRAMYCSLRGN